MRLGGTKRDEEIYFARLRGHLEQEYQLLRAAFTVADPGKRVPTCPEWTADRLAHHVAATYLHKVEAIRTGVLAAQEPALDEAGPVEALDEAYAALAACFAEHRPADPAATWYGPDQSVGFWIRRMCHESVVHRVDAELVAGLELAPIPDDIAQDGVEEFLTLALEYRCEVWPEHFAAVLEGADPRPVAIAAGDRSWTVTAGPKGIAVGDCLVPEESAYERNEAARIGGAPGDVLLWLWGRTDERVVHAVGDPVLVNRFLELRKRGT
ncbi:MAG TPA: maleylpyruvate isomerase N-terminal domain-containing protein [Actinospica sp.]|nr:maleylpyruvate isomerase N-terminal domain-containing protein [Actinospica sp.]